MQELHQLLIVFWLNERQSLIKTKSKQLAILKF